MHLSASLPAMYYEKLSAKMQFFHLTDITWQLLMKIMNFRGASNTDHYGILKLFVTASSMYTISFGAQVL